MSTTRRLIAAALVTTAVAAGSIVGGTGVPAFAATPSDTVLAALKTRGAAEIDRRLTTLTTLTSVVGAATHLSASDRAALAARLSSETSGLQSLETKIAGDTDVTTARADVQSIVTAFRVYVLVEPEVHLVRAADAALDAAERFTTLEPKLQAAIDTAKAKGADVTAEQAAMTDLQAKVSAAHDLSAAVPGQVLPLTPAQWPAAHDTLVAARGSLDTARVDLKQARTDAQSIVTALKASGK